MQIWQPPDWSKVRTCSQVLCSLAQHSLLVPLERGSQEDCQTPKLKTDESATRLGKGVKCARLNSKSGTHHYLSEER